MGQFRLNNWIKDFPQGEGCLTPLEWRVLRCDQADDVQLVPGKPGPIIGFLPKWRGQPVPVGKCSLFMTIIVSDALGVEPPSPGGFTWEPMALARSTFSPLSAPIAGVFPGWDAGGWLGNICGVLCDGFGVRITMASQPVKLRLTAFLSPDSGCQVEIVEGIFKPPPP